MNRSQLERIVSTVNLAVQELPSPNADRVLLATLAAYGIDECLLGSAHLGVDCWFWYPCPPTRTVLIQYGSGRCAVVGG